MHHVVAGALVTAGRVLLGHRSPLRHRYPDVWDLPGGHVEQGESEPQALAREMREELGVQVLVHDSGPLTRLHVPGDEQTEGLKLSVWNVRKWRGDPVNQRPDEHDKLGWFDVHDLDALALAHPSYHQLLRTVLAEQPNRSRT